MSPSKKKLLAEAEAKAAEAAKKASEEANEAKFQERAANARAYALSAEPRPKKVHPEKPPPQRFLTTPPIRPTPPSARREIPHDDDYARFVRSLDSDLPLPPLPEEDEDYQILEDESEDDEDEDSNRENSFYSELEEELGGLLEEDLEAALLVLGTTAKSSPALEPSSKKEQKPPPTSPSPPCTPLRETRSSVSKAQVQRLQTLLAQHYQLLVQQTVLAVRAAHKQKSSSSGDQVLAARAAHKQKSYSNSSGKSAETAEDLAEILDGAVGMLEDLNQNRKDAIRNSIQLETTNKKGAKRSLLPMLDNADGERRLTRSAFTKTLENSSVSTCFDVCGLASLSRTFDTIDRSVSSGVLQQDQAEACRGVLRQAGARIEENMVPGMRDLSLHLSRPKEVMGQDFEPPMTTEQKAELKRNRNQFTAAEDNLVLRGVNLYGEKQWLLIADRYLPDRSANNILQRYFKLCVLLYQAQGVYIDEEGNLKSAPKIKSLETLDEAALSKLKRVEPPANPDVNRWSLEEDLTLLKAVPLLGSMWAKLSTRFIPHRDRGQLRKRYQVLERRVKATVGKRKPSTTIVPGLTFSRGTSHLDADPIESFSSQSSGVDIYPGRRRKRNDGDTEEEEWTDENSCNGAKKKKKKKQSSANTRRKSTGVNSKAFQQRTLLSTPATRTRGRQARKEVTNLLSDDSDDESVQAQAVMSSPEPPPRRGQLTGRAKKVDAVRIATGNKVFHSDCGLSMEYDSAGRSKSLKLSYRASQPDDGVAKKPSKQKDSLVHHEISVEDTAGIDNKKTDKAAVEPLVGNTMNANCGICRVCGEGWSATDGTKSRMIRFSPVPDSSIELEHHDVALHVLCGKVSFQFETMSEASLKILHGTSAAVDDALKRMRCATAPVTGIEYYLAREFDAHLRAVQSGTNNEKVSPPPQERHDSLDNTTAPSVATNREPTFGTLTKSPPTNTKEAPVSVDMQVSASGATSSASSMSSSSEIEVSPSSKEMCESTELRVDNNSGGDTCSRKDPIDSEAAQEEEAAPPPEEGDSSSDEDDPSDSDSEENEPIKNDPVKKADSKVEEVEGGSSSNSSASSSDSSDDLSEPLVDANARSRVQDGPNSTGFGEDSKVIGDESRSTAQSVASLSCCCVCGETLDSARPFCRFRATGRFSRDAAMHVFCGLTASMNPNTLQYEISNAKGIIRNHTGKTTEGPLLVERAMKITRTAAVHDDSSSKGEIFYLVKDFEDSLQVVLKKFDGILTSTGKEGKEALGLLDETIAEYVYIPAQDMDRFWETAKSAPPQDGAPDKQKATKGLKPSNNIDEPKKKDVQRFSLPGAKEEAGADDAEPKEVNKYLARVLASKDLKATWSPPDLSAVSAAPPTPHSVPQETENNEITVSSRDAATCTVGRKGKRKLPQAELDKKVKRAAVTLNRNKQDAPRYEIYACQNVELDLISDNSHNTADDGTPTNVAGNPLSNAVAPVDRTNYGRKQPRLRTEAVRQMEKNVVCLLDSSSSDSSLDGYLQSDMGFNRVGVARKGNRKSIGTDGKNAKSSATPNSKACSSQRNNIGHVARSRVGTPSRALERKKDVGCRAYCRYKNGQYYWGTIQSKSLKNGSCQFHYTVLFDDGELVNNTKSQHVFTVHSFREKFEMEPPPIPRAGIDTDNDLPASGPLVDMDNTDHELLGRGICQEWTDVHGRNKIVYGKIVDHEVDPENDMDLRFTVEYNAESRAAANSISSVAGSFVPETRQLEAMIAFGGCLLFDRKRNPAAKYKTRMLSREKSMLSWTWVTPDMRKEELVELPGGVLLPRLSLVVRGFLLVFSVKQSTIPNAGRGVFVKATRLSGEDGDFILREGEFVDMGVYGPSRDRDRKADRVFFVKSYIHSFKCEEYSFNTEEEDDMIDITDDLSGEAHEMAKRRLLIYLNECKSAEVPSVRAEHDPEGNVHYLLGVAGESSVKRLVLDGDGEEKELFVNYGEDYEPVRLRKGYSELPWDIRQERINEMKREERQYLQEIQGFSGDDIAACVDFFLEVFSEDNVLGDKISDEVRRRAVDVLKLFRERAERNLTSEEAPGVDVSRLRGTIRSLLSLLEKSLERVTFVL